MSIDTLLILYILIVSTYYVCFNALGILINLFCKRFDVKRDFTQEPTVSVVMSCFNEGEAVYNTIKSMRMSDYPVEKLQILGIDDCSKDDSFSWMLKAAEDFPNVIVKQNVKNQGKAHNVLDAVSMSNGEVIVSIDTDCIFNPSAIRQLMACFTEPKIAAVGGRVGINNPNVNWLTRFQTLAYSLSFLMLKSPEKICRKIQCLSGPLVAIRRECFNEIKDEIGRRNFLGVKITNGEDRALTQMLLLRGYDTYLNNDAICYTNVPTDIPQYARQQLRWRRSAIGQYFQMIYCLPQMIYRNGFLSSIFSIMPIFVLLAWNTMIVSSWLEGKIIFALSSIVLCHLALGPCIVIAFYCYAKVTELVDFKDITLYDLLFSRLIAAFWYPLSTIIITLFALFTLDDGGWVTRETV